MRVYITDSNDYSVVVKESEVSKDFQMSVIKKVIELSERILESKASMKVQDLKIT